MSGLVRLSLGQMFRESCGPMFCGCCGLTEAGSLFISMLDGSTTLNYSG